MFGGRPDCVVLSSSVVSSCVVHALYKCVQLAFVALLMDSTLLQLSRRPPSSYHCRFVRDRGRSCCGIWLPVGLVLVQVVGSITGAILPLDCL